MTDASGSSGNYEVGYGKPPRAHQFTKGHTKSKGKRRKRQQSLQEMVEEVLLQPITVETKNGKPAKMPLVKAVLTKRAIAALKENEKATVLILSVAQKYLPQAPEDEGEEAELNEAETAVMANIMSMKALFAQEVGDA